MCHVKTIMTPNPFSVGPETTIDEAISKMLEHRVSGLPVVDAAGQLLGVISEIDIIDLVFDADIDTSTVGDYMARDVATLSPEASLDDAASKFSSLSVRRFPVLDDGRLVGILSRRDLLRFIRDARKQAVAG